LCTASKGIDKSHQKGTQGRLVAFYHNPQARERYRNLEADVRKNVGNPLGFTHAPGADPSFQIIMPISPTTLYNLDVRITLLEKAESKKLIKEVMLGGGIISIFFLASSILPLLGSVISIFIPVPILVYYRRLGPSLGRAIAIIAVITFLLMTTALSIPFNSIVIIQFALMGMLMAEAFEREKSVEKSILVPSFSLFVIGLVLVILHSAINHTTPQLVLHQYFSQTLNDTLELYRVMGISEEQIQKMQKAASPIIAVFIRIAPALLLGMTSIIVWINILICKKIFPRWGLSFPDFGDLTHWKSPESLVWLLIACGIGLLIPHKFLNTVSLNGLLIMLLIYFFQGMGIVAYFFRVYRISPVIRIVGYILITIQQFILILVVALGLFDLWFDFRRISQSRLKSPGSN
jgi:uncharacterized protein YybS (DUF2232 family)